MSPLATFLNTFGYVVVRGVYDPRLIRHATAAYDAAVAAATQKTMADYLKGPLKPILGGLETSQELVDFVLNSRILPVVEELIGDDAIFCGSDLSTFKGGSQFHRDAFGDYKLLKVGIYLQDTTPKDGGQFACIPGSHHFGDEFSSMCSNGLMWPKGAGYADNTFIGHIDFKNNQGLWNIPAVGLDLAVGDAVFFNPALVHTVPATDRLRRMIALLFFEGEKLFNSRPHDVGPFKGLSHRDTIAAMRMAFYECERRHGREARVHYHPKLAELKLGRLERFLRDFTDEEYAEINERVLGNSYAQAHRFITQQEPA